MAAGPGPRRFCELPELSPETLQVLETLQFDTATPVQEATIPLFCGNKDVAVDASTGSGKTLAFVIPIVEKLRRLDEKLKKYQVGAVIISPTRELARQIWKVSEPFVHSIAGTTCQLLVGGTDPVEDVARFKESGAHVLIGTPGRIDDIMKRCAFMEFKRLEVLVMDEADKLLDMGFKMQLDSIMSRLPRQRRTGLFSATQTEAVEALARAGLRNPVRVNVAVTSKRDGQQGGLQQKTPMLLDIQYLVCEADEKLQNLVLFLKQHSKEKVIAYCLTCSCVDFYNLALKKLGTRLLPGLQVKALHGRMKQAARETTLEAYTKLPAGVLLCTDLAARGLDIPDVNWILQLDPPQDPSSFVHRVGRTARMGRVGHALVFLMPHEVTYVEFLKLSKVPLVEMALPEEWDEALGQALPLIKREAETDREVMEAGMRAFVSYVRGYKEHHCKYIFRIQDLSMGRLATSFGLLRLPRMAEIKRPKDGPGIPDFTPSQVEPDSVKFKDKTREKQRQQTLQSKAEKSKAEQASGAAAVKRVKQEPKPGASKQDFKAGERLTATKRRQLQQHDELRELQSEYTLLKKLKKGKISSHEFDVATGLSSDSDQELEEQAPPARGHAAETGAADSDEEGGELQAVGATKPGARKQGKHAKGAVVSLTGGKLQQYMDSKKRRQKRKGKGGSGRG